MSDKMAYIVTEGEYSDYSIRAVYDNQADAEAHVARWGGQVEEYEINALTDALHGDGREAYVVKMRRDGDVLDVEVECGLYAYEYARLRSSWVSVSPKQPVALGVFHVLARDKQHAIKIANERRTRAIAEGRWPEEFPYNKWGYGGDQWRADDSIDKEDAANG